MVIPLLSELNHGDSSTSCCCHVFHRSLHKTKGEESYYENKERMKLNYSELFSEKEKKARLALKGRREEKKINPLTYARLKVETPHIWEYPTSSSEEEEWESEEEEN